MACNIVSVDESTLHCSICLEKFVCPRTLPCLHSFCHTCLLGYVEKVSAGKSDSDQKGFHCPCCRMFIPNSDPDPDVTTWINTFPVNFTLVSIIDSSIQTCSEVVGSDEVDVVNNELSRSLFSNCSLSDNYGCDLKTEEADSEESAQIRHLGKCPNHATDNVTYFCTDHKEYCCSECVISNHRKCDNLIKIGDKIVACRRELREQIDRFYTAATTACVVFDKYQEHCARRLKISGDEAREEVHNVTKLIRDYADTLESKLLRDIEGVEEEGLQALRPNCDRVGEVRTKVTEAKDLLETADKHGSQFQCHFAASELNTTLLTADEELRDQFGEFCIEIIHIPELAKLREEVDRMTKNELKVARKKTDECVPPYPNLKPLIERTPILRSQLCVDNHGNIDGCQWINTRTIIITEKDKRRASLIDIRLETAVNRITFKTPPWQMAKINNFTLAVSFPEERMVRMLQVVDDSIEVLREIPVQGVCYGIACYKKDHLLVLLQDEGMIAIQSIQGTRLGYIPVNNQTKSDIRNSYCMAFDPALGHIYLSCHNTSKVACIDTRGNQLFEYSPNKCKCPWGIEVDGDYNVYVCWFGSSHVHQISPSGEFIRDIVGVGEIPNPLILTLNDNQDSFVLTASQNGKNVRHYRYI